LPCSYWARACAGFAPGYLGHGHFPPPAAILGRARGIGIDADDIGAVRGARALKRGREAGEIVDMLGLGTECTRVRCGVDMGRGCVEQVVE
jgi:hypothetical protein